MSHITPNAPVLDNFWMPFTANRQFKAAPRLLAGAEGMYYTDVDGNKVMDGTAGLWCCNAGHGRRKIADAVQRQLMSLDFAPTFQMGHPIVFDFAAKLASMAPGGPDAKLDRIFFTGSGSESIDTALKIAIAYQRAIGQGTRTRVIGREKGYHGVGFGGISVGGLVNNRRMFPQIPADHMRHTLDVERNAFTKGMPEQGADLADDLERLVALHGAETIAAVVVEPMSGSAGVILPPKGYLERLRAIATKHGILLIFDEVITGFGRLGTPFATDFFGVVPDLITTAKGITNGSLPMGAVFAGRHVYDGMMTGPENAIELFHGYTYSGHPVACAAGLATMEIYEEEGLLTRAAEIAPEWEAALHSLKGLPNVVDIRNLGLVGAIELAPRAGAPGARAYDVFVDCFNKGLLIRVTGDIIALSPPLIIERAEIATLVSILGDALKRAA
ncbi:aspartate aminotransferase family protein [Acidisoma silvae]|uniref:Aspartate aminotransferase family protein n=1 Tax=Acidisoma silvae TaxID=2802396 RepID=A0A963YTC5_9PROT|nr:aspartate aminotransferase family protein [Acidisoma silvae]MCB8876294.1 aspartate aminotransferase family protein [Acidisoma silvae]